MTALSLTVPLTANIVARPVDRPVTSPVESTLAMDGSELVQHLLTDLLIKVAIVLGAAAILIVGMVVLWRRLG